MRYIKNLATAGIMLVVVTFVSAQSPRKPGFATTFPGIVKVLAVDASGNTFVAGQFTGSETFGSVTLNSKGFTDVFVVKVDPTGNIINATGFGSSDGSSDALGIDVDNAGNVYITGYYGGLVDFDQSTNDFELTPAGDVDGYILKLNPTLDFIWAGSIGGPGYDAINAVAVNSAQEPYITGEFSVEADLDPTSGSNTFDESGTTAFFEKLDSDGEFVWAKTVSNANLVSGLSVTLDLTETPIFSGYYFQTVDINPDGGIETLTGQSSTDRDIFILKLTTAGVFTWGKSIGGNGDANYSRSIASDGQNNIYVTGFFYGTGDFNPDPVDEEMLTSNGDADIFVTKFDESGNLLWAHSFGGGGFDSGADVVANSTDVFLTGRFFDEVDFGTTDSDFVMSYETSTDAFILNLDANGDLKWVGQLGGESDEYGYEMAIDNTGNIYTLGELFSSNDNDMDPSCGVLYLDPETEPGFLLKISTDPAECLTITKQPVGADVCAGAQVILSVEATGTGLTYQWMIRDSDGGFGDVIDGGGVYSGAQTASLTVNTNADHEGEGVYVCVVSKSGFTDETSDEAFIDVGPNTPYIAADIVNCGPGTATIKASGGQPGQYRWYTVETGGSPLTGVNNDTYTTPSLSVTTSYYVSVDNGSCESPRAKVTVYITACEPPPALRWAKTFGGASTDGAGEIILLSDGNILVPGSFTKSADLDPGPGEFILTAADGFQDAYLMKMTPDGEIIWVKQFTGNTSSPSPSFVKEDPNGNIYLAGTIVGNATDFDAGAGTLNIAGTNGANNFPDAYIVKFDKDGNALWGKKMGNPDDFDGIAGLEVDANAAYITGYFWDTFTLDANTLITFGGDHNGTDIFISKISSAGTVVWLKQIGNSFANGNVQTDAPTGLFLRGGDLYMISNVSNATTDVDPNAGVHNISPEGKTDGYVLKLTTDGDYQSVFKYSGSVDGVSNIGDILVDDSNIYLSGNFVHTVDFDPGTGTFNITSTGGISGSPATNGFITKHTLDGTLVWAKALQVNNLNDAYGGDMTLASNGDLIVSGMYQGSVDFDPGPLKYVMTGSSLFLNSYLLKLNAAGEFNWALSLARIQNVSSSASGGAHFVDATGDIYMQGIFRGSVDFDPLDCKSELLSHPNEPLTVPATYSQDYYLWKLSFNAANICFQTMPADINTCAGSEELFTALAVGAPGITYQWQRSDMETGTYQNLTEGNGYSGTTSSELKVNTAAGFGAGFYRVIASAPNAADKTSDVAELAFAGTSPDAPVTTGAATCESEGDFSLVASGSLTGDYQWYDAPTGGLPYALTGDTFETGLITSSITVYVSAIDGVCESARTPVTATVNTGDTAPVATGASRCGPGALTLSATGAADGLYRWYTAETGGLISGQTDATYTTPSLDVTTTFYVNIVLADCESPRVAAIATISAPVVPVVANTSACLNAPANITATVPGGDVYWYSEASGGTPFFSGATFTTPVLTTNVTYYLSNVVGDCESERLPVNVTVSDCAGNQPPVIAATNATTYVGGIATVDLIQLLSDPDNNLDMSTLKIVTQPTSGAIATIEDGKLIIDYTGNSFAGEDEVTIEVCDISGSCVQQVIKITVASDIVVYNAVSPNDDGKNDVFFIGFIDSFEATRNNRVRIFNRWGALVFDIENYNNTTNVFAGKNNHGNELPSGTYFYKIEFEDGRKTESGYLALKR